jgi:hypothetical protein
MSQADARRRGVRSVVGEDELWPGPRPADHRVESGRTLLALKAYADELS